MVGLAHLGAEIDVAAHAHQYEGMPLGQQVLAGLGQGLAELAVDPVAGQLLGHADQAVALTDDLRTGLIELREHHQPAHLLRRVGIDPGLQRVGVGLEDRTFEVLHQRAAHGHQLEVRVQPHLAAHAQLGARQVAALRHAPFNAQGPGLGPRLLDQETLGVARLRELGLTRLGPFQNRAPARGVGTRHEPVLDLLYHHES
mmetsp:Transcript_45397/g.126279  ORF Transcript_45397/g.126279 Transcript_45397/m.126279 type:complete len:200 (-) Transcript_45397:738-1337(-)